MNPMILSLLLVSEVGVVERLGERLPAQIELRDPRGEAVSLGALGTGGRPVLLVLAYYRCSTLCSVSLRNLARAVRRLDWKPGIEFELAVVSFDPDDTALEAGAQQRSFLQLAGDLPPDGVYFFTGARAEIGALLAAGGVSVEREATSGDFRHVPVALALDPGGKITRYLYTVEFPAEELKLALFEAASGKVGTPWERVLLRCWAYDPATRKYGLAIRRVFQLGGLVLLGVVGGGLAALIWRDRRRSRGGVG
jgi:protein SCO1/2